MPAQRARRAVTTHYDRRNAEDAIQTLGVVLGGVVRIVTPKLDVDGELHVLEIIERACIAAEERDAAAHTAVALEFYDWLITRCPNATLSELAATTLAQMRIRYGRKLEERTPNWQLLLHGWSGMRTALLTGDPIAAELAFEDMHRLPLAHRAWEPATWRDAEDVPSDAH
ncbi:FCD domain-containing protein [Leucobacter musarum]|uniref:FCD domain-containing protein n=1 Tax=Leucobacter musarum TaxID=1930747 RepID=UPI0006A7B140|nr:FCD domain-containing protein [Leucobacter musarum]